MCTLTSNPRGILMIILIILNSCLSFINVSTAGNYLQPNAIQLHVNCFYLLGYVLLQQCDLEVGLFAAVYLLLQTLSRLTLSLCF